MSVPVVRGRSGPDQANSVTYEVGVRCGGSARTVAAVVRPVAPGRPRRGRGRRRRRPGARPATAPPRRGRPAAGPCSSGRRRCAGRRGCASGQAATTGTSSGTSGQQVLARVSTLRARVDPCGCERALSRSPGCSTGAVARPPCSASGRHLARPSGRSRCRCGRRPRRTPRRSTRAGGSSSGPARVARLHHRAQRVDLAHDGPLAVDVRARAPAGTSRTRAASARNGPSCG